MANITILTAADGKVLCNSINDKVLCPGDVLQNNRGYSLSNDMSFPSTAAGANGTITVVVNRGIEHNLPITLSIKHGNDVWGTGTIETGTSSIPVVFSVPSGLSGSQELTINAIDNNVPPVTDRRTLSLVIVQSGNDAIVVDRAHVKLLMHFDGDSGSSAFIDETGNNVFTASGGAIIVSTEHKFGGGAGRFIADHSAPCISTSDNRNFSLINDFTIAGWFKWVGASPNFPGQQLIGCHRSGVYCDWALYWDNLGSGFPLRFIFNNEYIINPPFMPNTQQWYHVAVTRSVNTIRMYINGEMKGKTDRQSNCNVTNQFTIGNSAEGSQYHDVNVLNGYVDEIIIRNDVDAEWATDAGFAVPTKPYALSNP